MTPEDLQLFAELLKRRSGLILASDKAYLLNTRLRPLARKHGFHDLDDLIAAIRQGGDEDLLGEVTDAITTNESFFFRDGMPFERFKDTVLSRLIESRAKERSIRIWCAAASTGQEPYSLAMVLDEKKNELDGWQIDIVATDISPASLERARSGVYSQFEVQRGLPAILLVKYFKKLEDGRWEIDPSLRKMVNFQELNLLKDFKSLGRFDVVFCRNVLIYFDNQTKGDILERIGRQMAGDGLLFLGGAETVYGISERFIPSPGLPGIYTLNTASEASQWGIAR